METPIHEQIKTEMEKPAPIPGPSNFSLDDFIEERSTFPVIEHTVYLDQNAGYQLLKVSEDIEKLEYQMENLQRGVESERESLVLGMGERAPSQAALDAVIRNLKVMHQRYAELEKTVLNSALLMELQCKDFNGLVKVQNSASKEFYEQHGIPEGTEEADLPSELVEELNRYTISMTLAYLCVRITRVSDGVCQSAPISASTIQRLQSRLGLSEVSRLTKAVNEVFDISKQWVDRIDAGFHSRGTDVA